MNCGCKTSAATRIRIHDLRHSHMSLLINMGFSVLDIAERVSHETIGNTYRYAHLFPAKRALIQSLYLR
ncbi:tyrosine-type recombinase/integrase [Eggerthellaceae bacterium PR-HUZ602407-17]